MILPKYFLVLNKNNKRFITFFVFLVAFDPVFFAFLDEDFDAFLDDDFLVFLALPLEDDLFLEAPFEDDFLEDFDFLCDLNLFSI